MKGLISCRLGLQQRVFPAYRAAFFDLLAQATAGGVSVFSGDPLPDEALGQEGRLAVAQHVKANNLYLGWGPFLTVWQVGISRWLETWQPDVLIADTNPRNASTAAAVRWMRRRGRAVIGWGLGAPPRRGPLSGLSKLFEVPRRRFLSQFDAIIAYSATGAEQYAAVGFPRERLFIAPNAVTPRPQNPPPPRPAGFTDGRARVIFVGRLQARKRVDALLRACAALPEAIQPRLWVVGDGPEREPLQNLARAVYPRAEFCGDRRGPALESLLAAADVFVLPGTGGLAVQQAMSAALPVIVAEADGTQSALVREQNGWLLPPNDDQALVVCLKDALTDPARLRRMGAESYRVVAEEVNLERMVAVFAEAVAYARRHRR